MAQGAQNRAQDALGHPEATRRPPRLIQPANRRTGIAGFLMPKRRAAMKNPIRAWVAGIAREEIYEERRERNLETIKAEISRPLGWDDHNVRKRELFMAELDAGREAIKRRRGATS